MAITAETPLMMFSILKADKKLLPSLRHARLGFYPLTLAVVFLAHAANFAITVPQDLSAPDITPIQVTGLPPGAVVHINTVRRDSEARTYVSGADFVADSKGQVDTSTTAPLRGAYSGVDATALFWAAQGRQVEMNDPVPGEVLVIAKCDGLGTVTAKSHTTPQNTRVRVSTDTPFPGAVWARPRSGSRHPVVILLGGSEGGAGLAKAYAPIFAGRGYATLGLPYYNPAHEPSLDPLPSNFTEIPIDRLEAVRTWLASQPDADADRIGLWGISKGAEFVLLAASHYPWVKAVVAIAPTDVEWQGWGQPGPPTSSFSFRGQALPFVPYGDYAAELDRRRTGGGDLDILRIHRAGRAEFPDRLADAQIPIEHFSGLLLLVAGEADNVWPSAEMARNIEKRRRLVELPTTLLVFPNAEHALGGPGTVPLDQVGVNEYASIHARRSAWSATFQTFQKALAH